ncbi:TMEM175 family protein [Sphingomonas sp. 28-63-12]|uniref:TMEM175 family protein n=1 Tax=Sphingomonas sp. 28-63-12 TaxID=1970434 RepID=UPI000BD0651C|nr:MAG: hypothetical protein B7Y47_07380 [Sphingomonas sp. 28-63-12]
MSGPANYNDQPMATRHGPEHTLERLIFFSDAVFAIAITLLVIELHVPELEPGASNVDFINALLRLTPNFIGFVVSFYVIGAFWAGHHRAFACAAHYSDKLLPANINLLLTIAAMPFFTAFLSNYSNQRVPVVLYCCWLLLTALLNIRMGRLATSPPVVDPTVPVATIAMIRRRGIATALGAATAIIVGLFSPWPILAQVSLIAIPLWRVMLGWLARRR